MSPPDKDGYPQSPFTHPRFFHLMFLPLDFDAGHLLEFALFVLPFILIYVWHIRHDHRHNTELISKLEETNRLLKKILRKLSSGRKD